MVRSERTNEQAISGMILNSSPPPPPPPPPLRPFRSPSHSFSCPKPTTVNENDHANELASRRCYGINAQILQLVSRLHEVGVFTGLHLWFLFRPFTTVPQDRAISCRANEEEVLHNCSCPAFFNQLFEREIVVKYILSVRITCLVVRARRSVAADGRGKEGSDSFLEPAPSCDAMRCDTMRCDAM